MIGKLSGLLDSIVSGQVIVDVNGVGYLVSVSPQTLSKLGGTGEPVTLYIDTHVREDALNLFGFADTIEQEWFRLLISVQGPDRRRRDIGSATDQKRSED
jgi:Holliday junction DNA helicase RuvA